MSRDDFESVPRLVPVARSRQVFGLPRSTVYRLVHEGRLVIRKLGRSSYLEAEEVLRLIASLPTMRPNAPQASTNSDTPAKK